MVPGQHISSNAIKSNSTDNTGGARKCHIQQGIAYAIVGAADLWDHYVALQQVESENTELKAKVTELYEENQRLRETLALAGGEMELDAFAELYEETYGYRGVKAMIIGDMKVVEMSVTRDMYRDSGRIVNAIRT